MNRHSAILVTLAILILGLTSVHCGGSASISELTAHELFELGKAKYEDGKHLRAIEYFQAIVYSHPGESIIDTAQYYLALTYFGNKDYELAQVEFNRLVLNYPASTYFEHAMLMRAVSVYESGPGHYGLDQTDLEQAIKLFEDFIIDFPESNLLGDAQKYLDVARTKLAYKIYDSAVVYKRMGAFRASKIYFQIVIDEYTDTKYAPLAVFGLAESELKSANFDEAWKQFDNFLSIYPDHELAPEAGEKALKASFSAGVVAFETGQYDQAETIFRELLEKFRENDTGKYKTAYEYLDKIDQAVKNKSKVTDADAANRGELGDTGRDL